VYISKVEFRYKTVLSNAYQLALKSDRVSRNPARLVERRNEGDGRIRYLRSDEEVRLRAAITRRCPGHLPAFVFALHTGLRKSEQFGLTWSDIDFDRRVIIVPHPKNDRSREVTMSETCLGLLRNLHEKRPDEEHVFRSNRYKKQPIIDIKKAFDSAVKDAKIEDFTWHCLRHIFHTPRAGGRRLAHGAISKRHRARIDTSIEDASDGEICRDCSRRQKAVVMPKENGQHGSEANGAGSAVDGVAALG
jgi:integrase